MTVSSSPSSPESSVVIEWAPFQPRAGVSEESLLMASRTVQTEFLEKQTGYIKRELFKGSTNQWVDLVYWRSMEDAERAMNDVQQSAACHAYFEMMSTVDADDPNQGIEHYALMACWE